MNERVETFIAQCLADVPPGKYRTRAEKELWDHMETQYQVLIETGMPAPEARGRVLETMGNPEQLREEYQAEYEAAWRRSLPGRLEELKHWLKAWTVGWFVMLMAHILACYARNFVYDQFVPDLRNSWLWLFLPLSFALMVGAYYLGRKFRTSRHPAWQIGVGLSFHWAFIFAFEVWWEAADDHRTFLEELWGYLTYHRTFWYYSLTLALCVLLGVVFGRLFGQKAERRREPA